MPSQDVLRDIELLLQSRYGLIHICTDEVDRALYHFHGVGKSLSA